MNLVSVLHERARRHPHRTALIDRKCGRDRTLTFSELSQRIESGAALLRDLGLRPGQTVMLFQPVSLELYEILLSALHAGIRVMLVDPSNGFQFVNACCRRLAPDALFGPRLVLGLSWVVSGLRRIPLKLSSNGWMPLAVNWQPTHQSSPMETVEADAPALITFTSGSTGVPKAAVRSHRFLLTQHRVLADSLSLIEGEVDLITLPVFVLANLASGLTSVLADTDLRRPGKANAPAILRQCQAHQVTRCSASPAFFEALLKESQPLPAFRKVFTGGAPVFPDLLTRLTEALPSAEISAVFGSTEAEPIAHLEACDYSDELLDLTAKGRGLCTGRIVDSLELAILQDHSGTPLASLSESEFAQRRLSSPEIGEIVVSGDHVLKGYLDGVGDEETKIHVGRCIWHRTGDIGCIEAESRLWLLGRGSAKLPDSPSSSNGPTEPLVYPFAIESALRLILPGHRTAALGWNGKRTLVCEHGLSAEEADLLNQRA
ncbi:MAG: AMP-dependent synthetase [Verrucomicrobiales bacterium VVV1]|nr:MAG: AMP-dependent synthetase [Verrucomicrobiales bacterium VVV1]